MLHNLNSLDLTREREQYEIIVDEANLVFALKTDVSKDLSGSASPQE